LDPEIVSHWRTELGDTRRQEHVLRYLGICEVVVGKGSVRLFGRSGQHPGGLIPSRSAGIDSRADKYWSRNSRRFKTSQIDPAPNHKEKEEPIGYACIDKSLR
jgi:hypothetical protein